MLSTIVAQCLESPTKMNKRGGACGQWRHYLLLESQRSFVLIKVDVEYGPNKGLLKKKKRLDRMRNKNRNDTKEDRTQKKIKY